MLKDIKKLQRNTLRDYRDLENGKRITIAILLLAVSAGLVTAGVMRGEVLIVFTKPLTYIKYVMLPVFLQDHVSTGCDLWAPEQGELLPCADRSWKLHILR